MSLETPLKLVLLPGLDGSGYLFEPLLAQLSPHFNCHIIRYAPDCTEGYQVLIEQAAMQLIDLTGNGEPYILLGKSFSGPIAIELAARHPAGLRGLVLCATFTHCPHPLLKSLERVIDVFPILGKTADSKMALYALLGLHPSFELRRLAQRALEPLSKSTIRARLKAVAAVDMRAAFAKVEVPVLYLQARHDRLVLDSAAQSLLRQRPDMQFEAFNTAHGLLQIAPRQAASSIERFTNTLEKYTYPASV